MAVTGNKNEAIFISFHKSLNKIGNKEIGALLKKDNVIS